MENQSAYSEAERELILCPTRTKSCNVGDCETCGWHYTKPPAQREPEHTPGNPYSGKKQPEETSADYSRRVNRADGYHEGYHKRDALVSELVQACEAAVTDIMGMASEHSISDEDRDLAVGQLTRAIAKAKAES